METFQQENESLKKKNPAYREGAALDHSEQSEGEAHSVVRMNVGEEEKKKLYDKLRNLIDKYEEMARRIWGSSLVDQLLNRTNLPYILEVMAVPLPPKFKVPQIELYDRLRDPINHLKNFMAHMNLHRFLEEVACRDFH